MKPEVKPCPFCGATQVQLDKLKGLGLYVFQWSSGSKQPTESRIACLQCGIGGPLERWNKRVVDTPQLDKNWKRGMEGKWRKIVSEMIECFPKYSAQLVTSQAELKGILREIKRQGFQGRCKAIDGHGWLVKLEKKGKSNEPKRKAG